MGEPRHSSENSDNHLPKSPEDSPIHGFDFIDDDYIPRSIRYGHEDYSDASQVSIIDLSVPVNPSVYQLTFASPANQFVSPHNRHIRPIRTCTSKYRASSTEPYIKRPTKTKKKKRTISENLSVEGITPNPLYNLSLPTDPAGAGPRVPTSPTTTASPFLTVPRTPVTPGTPASPYPPHRVIIVENPSPRLLLPRPLPSPCTPTGPPPKLPPAITYQQETAPLAEISSESSAPSASPGSRPPTALNMAEQNGTGSPTNGSLDPTLARIMDEFDEIRLAWDDEFDELDMLIVPKVTLLALVEQARGFMTTLRKLQCDIKKCVLPREHANFARELENARALVKQFVREGWTIAAQENEPTAADPTPENIDSLPPEPRGDNSQQEELPRPTEGDNSQSTRTREPLAAALGDSAPPALNLPRPGSAVSATSTVATEILADHVNDRCESLCDEVARIIDDFGDLCQVSPRTNQEMRDLEARLAVTRGESNELLDELRSLTNEAVKAELRAESKLLHENADSLRNAGRRAAASVRTARQQLGLPAAGGDKSERGFIKPPVFSGKLGDKLDYYSFIKRFNDYTENQGIYSTHEKLIKLRTECVTGEAYDAICDIDDFASAMLRLKVMYAKPEILFAFKVQELSALGKCPETAVERKSWFINVQNKLQKLRKLSDEHNLEDCLDLSEVASVVQAGLREADHKLFEDRLMKLRVEDPTLRITRKLIATEMAKFIDWMIVKSGTDLDYRLALQYRNASELFKGLKINSDKAKPTSSKKAYHATDAGEGLEGPTEIPSQTGSTHASSDPHTSKTSRAANHVESGGAAGQDIETNRSHQPVETACKVCNSSHLYLAYCPKFQAARVKDRWGLVCKAGACYRCLRLDANFLYKRRTDWWNEHKTFCTDKWVCDERECKKQKPIRQNHFLICGRHIAAGEERQNEFIKSLDEKLLPASVTFYFSSAPMFTNAPHVPLTQLFGNEIEVDLVEPDIQSPPIYILQYMETDAKEKLLIFFDSGCYSAGISNRAFSILTCREVRRGPTTLDLAGNYRQQIPYGDYQFLLPLEVKVRGKHKQGTFTALRMEELSSTFPLWPLQEAWEELDREYRVAVPGGPPLPAVESAIGGCSADIMLGIRYLRYFPRPIFSLPSGLSVYRTVIRGAGGMTGVLGGPHKAWEKALESSHLTTARIFLSSEMKALSSQNAALRKVMSLPEPCGHQLGAGNFGFDAEAFGACSCDQPLDDFGMPCAEGRVRRALSVAARGLKDFLAADNIGSEVEYRCPKCRNCFPCKNSDKLEKMSLIEEKEQHLIENCVTLDRENSVVVARLPFIANPQEKLNPNKKIAHRVLETQLRLIRKCPEMKEDILKSHNKLASKGHVVPIDSLPADQRAAAMEDGYFIPWRTVYKVDSLSTPCRMVFDASSRTPGGESLNEILAKGQNKLAGLFNLLVKFRAGSAAFSADISMAYNSIKLHPSDYKYQKYLWLPDLDEKQVVITMVVLTLIYGVKAAGNLTMAGFQLVADAVMEMYPEFFLGAEALKYSAYMDDLFKAFFNDVDRDNATTSLDGTLQVGSMSVKAVTKSGQPPSESVSADGKTVGIVGYLWYVVEDTLGLDIKPLSLGKSKRGKPPPPIVGDIRDALKKMFTRRILAGKVAGVYDPLGFAAPLTGRLKLDLSMVCKEAGGWDTPLPEKYLEHWVQNLMDIQQLKSLRVPRNVMGRMSKEDVMELIVCCDASEALAVAAVYARVPNEDGSFECNLVAAKTKLVSKSTVPRGELRAACLGASLGHVVAESYKDNLSRVTFVTDSAITLCWINQDQRPLMCGVRNAVIEIRRLSNTDQWKHVPTDHNPADIGTRPISVEDLMKNEEWFHGCQWMKNSMLDAPLKTLEEIVLSDTEKVEVQKETRSQEHRGIVLANFLGKISERQFFSDFLVDPLSKPWPKLLRTLTLVVKCCKIWRKTCSKLQLDDMRKPLIELSADDGAAAERYIFQQTTLEVEKFVDAKKLQKIGLKQDGILLYKGRVLDGTKPESVGKVMLDLEPLHFCKPILDRHSPVAAAIMTHAHVDLTHHGGVASMMRRSREIAFILEGRALAIEIKKACVYCKRYDAKLLEAEMGPIHPSRLLVAPAFYSCQVDLFGPFDARCEHNHRAKVKVWGAAFKCTTTGALAVEVMAGYDAANFLHAYSRFATRFGHPGRIHIDEGSQLKKAFKEMSVSVADLANTLDGKYGVKVDLVFSPVGGHESSGMVERAIREIRRIFNKIFRGKRLDILGFQTAFSFIANELNSMPLCIGSKYENLDSLDLITPSRLILGRNNNRAPVGTNTLSGARSRLLRQMDEVNEAWWRAWESEKLADLVPRSSKWSDGQPDVEVGDIVVFLRDGRESRLGTTPWRVGRILEVEMSQDGIVRAVVIEYKNADESVFRTTRRSVRTIAVLVREHESDVSGQIATSTREATIHMLRWRSRE